MIELDFSKIQILNISTTRLTMLIREQCPGLSLKFAVMWARSLKEVHRLGEVRGRILR